MKGRYFRIGIRKIKLLPLIITLILVHAGLSVGGEKAEIFVQLGHSDYVQSLAFSPDGKYLASGSGDKTIKLWDVETGREIRTMATGTGFTSVAFSPDGQVLASAGGIGNNVVLWSVKDGRTVRKLRMEGDHNYLNDVAFSPDGTTVAAASHIIQFFNAGTGRTIRVIKNISEYGKINCVAFSPDGKYLASGSGNTSNNSRDNTVRLWDVKTGEEIHRFSGHSRDVIRISFSPDGRYLASISEDKDIVIWDIKKREKAKILKGHAYNRGSIAFSPDGRYLADADFHILRLWDVATGRAKSILKDEDTTGAGIFPNAVGFSPDGRYAAVSAGYAFSLWDVAGGRKIRLFGGVAESSFDSYFSRDQDKIKVMGAGGTTVFNRIGGHYAGFQNTTSNIDKRFLRDCNDVSCRIIDKKTDTAIISISTMDYLSRLRGDRTYSPDGKYALIGADNKLKIVDLRNNRPAVILEDSPPDRKISGRAIFSNDGRYVAGWPYSTGDIPVIYLWEVSTGRQIFKKSLKEIVWTAVFTSDGKKIIAGSGENIYLLDAMTGREIRKYSGHTGSVGSLALSGDGKYLLSGSWDGKIKLWDFQTGKEIRTFTGHSNWVESVTFSRDNKNVLSSSRDCTTRLWDTASGREIAKFISFKDGEWIVMTPEGFFNASPKGAKHLNVQVGDNVYSIDNFFEKYFNPVYVATVLQGRKVEAVSDIRKGFMTPPDVRITSPGPNETISRESVSVTVSAKDTGGGVDEIRLYHNGKAVGEDTRSVKLVSKGREAAKTYTVTLVDGINTFRAVGFSSDRTESDPYELIVHLAAPQKDISMHVLAVGINRYRNPALNLNYAVPDAKGITDFFNGKGGELFKKVDIKNVYDEKATKTNITAELKALKNTGPQDVVLIYLAGHGENISDKWYFIPHELAYPEREEEVKSSGISSDELSGFIRGIKAQKVLVMIDSCKAGAMLIAMRGFEDRKALSQLSRSAGVHVIAASTKDQYAAEVKELGHGVFTYTLLEGLKGQASSGDKTITVRKLMTHVENRLPDITMRYRKETQFPVVDSRGMDFPLVIVK